MDKVPQSYDELNEYLGAELVALVTKCDQMDLNVTTVSSIIMMKTAQAIIRDSREIFDKCMAAVIEEYDAELADDKDKKRVRVN